MVVVRGSERGVRMKWIVCVELFGGWKNCHCTTAIDRFESFALVTIMSTKAVVEFKRASVLRCSFM